MKIFLDVGAHTGETLRAAVDPRFGFDHIACFEPVPQCCQKLARFRDPRISVHSFGLWNQTTAQPLHAPGSVGASVFAEKVKWATSAEIVHFVRASDWFRDNLSGDDTVYVKVNCEGAECDIIEDLIDSHEIDKVDAMLVYFDIRKIPGQRYRADQTIKRLTESSVPLTEGSLIVGSTHVDKISRWLISAGAGEREDVRPMERLKSARIRLRYVQVPHLIRSLRIGRLVYQVAGRRIHARLRSRIEGYTHEVHGERGLQPRRK